LKKLTTLAVALATTTVVTKTHKAEALRRDRAWIVD
jgi:hypothetical protein